jgi:phosphoserine phosphatase RsbU/P
MAPLFFIDCPKLTMPALPLCYLGGFGEAALLLGDRVANIIVGTIFLFAGLSAGALALLRRRPGTRAIIWLGLWSAMYGASPLANALVSLQVAPRWLYLSVPYLDTATSYLILVVALLAFVELSRDGLRRFLLGLVLISLGIAVAGIAAFIFTGSSDRFTPYNNFLATFTLIVLLIAMAVPRLSRGLHELSSRGVLMAGTLIFAAEALYANLGRPLGYRSPFILDSLAFAAFLFSLGYVAMQTMFSNERRLLAIERELAVAREIQASILPAASPAIEHLSIAATYLPMTAVAGDFYDFLPVDRERMGILVADVSGHGVPAALIASMIKVASQAVLACAQDPRQVLRGLDAILSTQLRGQFVSAAYLWLDTERRIARYSAAGHPPLLRWRDGQMDRIESNGLLLGVSRGSDYPVCELPLRAGDRFLLYTDAVTEGENSRGEAFGDGALEAFLRKNQSRPASELGDQLLSAIRCWQPAGTPQQDDLTLIVIDVE